jgi:hypothetical protein
MAIAMAGAAIVEAITLLILRRIPAAVSTSTVLVLVFIGGDQVMAITVWGVLFWVLLSLLWRMRRKSLAPHYHPAIVLIASIAFAISLAQVATSGALVLSTPPPRGGGPPDSPNIYVLILDAYARQDTLEAHGFDNTPFLSALEAEGFDVYRDSRSSYNYTSTVLASMLNFMPASELPGFPDGRASWQSQSGTLLRSINEAQALKVLAATGYRTVSIPPVARHAELFAVDRELDSGSLTDFERHILTDTALAGILEVVAPDWIADQYRDRIRHAFQEFGPQPPGTFMWAHVLMPHYPFLFDGHGHSRSLPPCLPGCPWTGALWGVGASDMTIDYIPQLQFTNRLVLASVSRVIAEDPHAVVVVMGDHGSRHDPTDIDETFRNLLAVRSPGHPRLLGPAPTTVNTLSAIFNAYLGTDLPRRPDAQFAGSALNLIPVPPVQ